MKSGLTRRREVDAKHKAYCARIRKQAEMRIKKLRWEITTFRYKPDHADRFTECAPK